MTEDEKINWNQSQGLIGESLAETFLQGQGFKILHRRYKTKYGEIDLIAEKKKCLYFVEVKWRRTPEYGDPLEAVTPAKVRHLKKAVYGFLQEYPHYLKEYDLDLAAIAIREYDETNKIELVPIRP